MSPPPSPHGPAPDQRRILLPLLLLALLLPALLHARPAVAQSGAPLGAALDADLQEVQEKMVSLGRAIPEAEWDWRPGPGIRSVAEVLKHVAYDNLYFPTDVGVAAPEETGITRDYATARAWGERPMEREEILAALEASFRHLRSAVTGNAAAALSEPVTIFDRELDRRRLWLLATTHAHEHLGQLIAYARTRGVVPPWSAGG
jgi:uncharacterized damage-inducible protein DinB